LLFRESIYLASSRDPTEEAEGVLYCGDGEFLHSDIDTKRKRMTSAIRSACDRAEREGLATTLPMVAPLNAFPFCSPQGPLQAHCAKSSKPCLLFPIPLSTSELAPKV
jgi:hypothetical protein